MDELHLLVNSARAADDQVSQMKQQVITAEENEKKWRDELAVAEAKASGLQLALNTAEMTVQQMKEHVADIEAEVQWFHYKLVLAFILY